MPLREQFGKVKGRVKETTRRVFSRSHSPAPSAQSSSVTQTAALPSADPRPGSPGRGGGAATQLSTAPLPHLRVTAPSIHSVPQSPGGSGDNPTQSTSSLPDQLTSSNLNPGPESRAVLTASDPVTRPASAPPGRGQIGIRGTWPCLNSFLQTLSKNSDVFGPLKPVIDGFHWCVEMYEDAATAQEDYMALRTRLEGLFNDMSQHCSGNVPPTMTASINNLCTAIESELDRISTKEERQAGRRYLEVKKDIKDVINTYNRIREHLERLRLNADLSMWRIVDEQATETRLKSLTPSMSACYNSAEAAQVGRRECTPKTREQVLTDLSIWRHDKEQGNMYWLNGMAGTGKTTIASSLCAMLDQSHELGASFFCTRQLPECRNVKLILPSIAYQLARFSRPFRFVLSQALQDDPDLHTKALPIQLQSLIAGPLRKVSHTLPKDLVMVVDALDEVTSKQRAQDPGDTPARERMQRRWVYWDIGCYATDQRFGPGWTRTYALPVATVSRVSVHYQALVPLSHPGPGVALILEILAKHASELPLKIFVSSRPEPEIRQKIGNTKSKLILHDLEKSVVQEDIERYLQIELADLSLSDSELKALVDRAGVLFIYAATVIRYIKATTFKVEQREQLQVVLGATTSASSRKNEEIDALYSTILASAFGNPKLEEIKKNQMRLVLNTVICAQEPITVDGLGGLLKLGHADWVLAALEPLWSVLHISGPDSLVTTLHASFPDYMLDPGRSKDYYCDSNAHHGRLSELCFERIDKNKQQFNICGLESSYLLDDHVSDLEERIKQAIPRDLAYACRYWAVHLEQGGQSESTKRLQLLDDFLSKRLLLWMEVLNLKKQIDVSAVLLEKARAWCKKVDGSQDTQALIHDAWRFATMFATNPVSRSTPHIYVSMLASWPRTGAISNRYVERSSGLTEVGGAGMEMRELALLGVFQVGTQVNAVSFSPNGMLIVSGSSDNTVSLWDAQSGKPVLDPLMGHTGPVTSVGFSPDGTRIVSGSYDTTVRVWEAQSGKPVLNPMEGHSDGVTSVAFSPDGMCIVSGSNDETVRLWNTQTGEPLLDPLEGHARSVNSVAFSPDGTRIISGSADESVLVWDAQSGNPVLELEGHTDDVDSVAFSPDGMRIASGSWDMTVRLWDAQSGKPVLNPLKGHTYQVTSVAFSPDGMHIVSASADGTVRLWDAQSGKLVIGPLKGHTSSVSSVAFSPDGMRIVSGSSDSTIHLWDAQANQPILRPDPLKGHADWVSSIAFSPDGTHIVSGSYDNTVRLWDAQSGRPVLGPLEGHTGPVNSVAFSPDGMLIASSSVDETVRLWVAQTGKPVLDPLEATAGSYSSVVFSPDGMRIIAISPGTLRLWDAQNGKPLSHPLEEHNGPFTSVAISPDGMRIASGSAGHMYTVRLWDAQNGKPVLDPLEGHASWVNSVAFSPDGMRLVSGSDDNTVRLWNMQTGKPVLDPFKGHTHPVKTVAFSPDGKRIVSGSRDNTVRVWDAQTGKPVLGPLKGHTSTVNSVAFSPNGMNIVSCSDDTVIRMWDIPHSTPRPVPTSPNDTRPSPDPMHPTLHVPSASLTTEIPSSTSVSWLVDEHGFVRDKHNRMLLWIPPDLQSHLLTQCSTFLISTNGSVRLNFEHAMLGESWVQCYTPA